MSAAGVDEDVIIAVLVRRNNEQRQKIKSVYEASTGNVRHLINHTETQETNHNYNSDVVPSCLHLSRCRSWRKI